MEHISRSLLSLYRGTPQHKEWVVACMRGAWQGIVGDRLARVCRPAAWNDHRLTIEADDPEWVRCLTEMKGDLMQKIRPFAGDEIREIEVRRI